MWIQVLYLNCRTLIFSLSYYNHVQVLLWIINECIWEVVARSCQDNSGAHPRTHTPAGTRRNNNVFTTSTRRPRRRVDVIFDVVFQLSLTLSFFDVVFDVVFQWRRYLCVTIALCVRWDLTLLKFTNMTRTRGVLIICLALEKNTAKSLCGTMVYISDCSIVS